MAKNIIFCADGTWNSPGQDDNNDHSPDPTNVYKLFMRLDGRFADGSITLGNEQEKEVVVNGSTTQVAKYIHGVGDSKNPIVSLMGGAFGAGVIARIVRGYTYISRMYEAGDWIHLVGFSRGAYTARALAGLIVSQGLLRKDLAEGEFKDDPEKTKDKNQAYRYGAQAWYRYRQKSLAKKDISATLAEVVSDLPAFLSRNDLEPSDFVTGVPIKSVAVWDTVGAIGIPDIHGDRRFDPFKFTDTVLSDRVEWGFHAVSLDEERVDFTPTLWSERNNGKIRQLLFPGAHADVGGGYAECGLSNAGLKWMIDQLTSVGVNFDQTAGIPAADAGGIAHMPWKGTVYLNHKRDFPKGFTAHASVQARMQCTKVQPDPTEKAKKYAPPNRPKQVCSLSPCGDSGCAECEGKAPLV